MMVVENIQTKVRNNDYLVKPHALFHALKEGFNECDMVDAVLSGHIVEKYPDNQRVLICGKTKLSATTIIFLHIVCEYRDPIYVEFVTAYIPDETKWYPPNFIRRKKNRK